MTAPEATSTRPYLIRALHEWCIDNGYTPHLAVRVDGSVQVPREFVRDGEIVLNVGFDATSSLQLGNDFIEFKARFGGQARDILVPVGRVIAIYAKESGQGMAFPEPDDVLEDGVNMPPLALDELSEDAAQAAPGDERVMQLVKSDSDLPPDDAPRTPPPAGGRPALKRVK